MVCSSATASYVYNAEGERVRKTTGGVSVDYLYDLGGHQIAEVNASGGWNRAEVYVGGRHVATYSGEPSGSTSFIHADWLGTERARTGPTGSTTETCTSLPFGDGQVCTGTDVSPLHFTGKQRDTETGNDDFGARYYNSGMARWLTPDWSAREEAVPYSDLTNPQTLNLYAYVGNNPTTRTDPDGHGTLMFGEPVVKSPLAESISEVDLAGIQLAEDAVEQQEAETLAAMDEARRQSEAQAANDPTQAQAPQPQVTQAQKQITVNLNVIYDQDANLSDKDKAKFNSMLKETEGLYGQIGIGFNVTYTSGSRVTDMGGRDVDVGGAKIGALNVFVSSALTVAEAGASGGSGASTKLQGNAVSFIGVGGPHWVLSHEVAHQFLGDTKRPPGFFSNLFRDIYINRFVLPHISSHAAELSRGALDFAGP